MLLLQYIKEGGIKVGDNISSHETSKSYEVKTLSVLQPDEKPVKELVAGQIGLIGCNMRTSKEAHIGT